MKKEQALGQLRALLTALGTVLVTWGVSDGNQWLPIIGVLLAGYSLTWGLLHHQDPATPGRMSWSLVRKFVNMLGTALVTYGVLHPDRMASIVPLFAALGPIAAAHFSWVDNNDDNSEPPAVPLWLLLLAMVPFLPSCAGTEYLTKGYIESPIGSFSTDGRTATYTPPVPSITFPIQGTK
jgi:hypothetical protein